MLAPSTSRPRTGIYDDLFAFQAGALATTPWGFSRIVLDREALAGGSLVLTGATGILPDGLPFDVPRSDPQPAPKPLEDFWRPDQSSMAVYLGVPEHRVGGHNVSMEGTARQTRFFSEVVMRRDENTGLAEKPLQLARRNLRLIVEGEARDEGSSLQVARVLRTASGELQLDPEFVPPLLDLAASERLMSLARRLVEILAAKSSDLAGTRRQRNRSLADFGASDVANFWLLYTVNTHLPELRHLYEVRKRAPGVAVRALLGLAGALTSFSTRCSRGPARLRPCGPRGVLRSAGRVIRELLETVVPANHLTLPLRRTDALLHATALDDDRSSQPPRCCSRCAALPPDEIVRRVPQLFKVSAADQIDQLIRQALPGMAAAPQPLSAERAADQARLSVLRHGPRRTGLGTGSRRSEPRGYVPSDFPDPQLELVVLLPPDGR
jgi:type VI secretion system protein ImpJ